MMGADQSKKEVPEPPFHPTPQLIPICATQLRFCLPYNVKLLLGQNWSSWSGGDFKVIDVNSNTFVFRYDEPVFSFEKSLIDNVGATVLKRSGKKVKIFAGEGNKAKVYEFKSRHPLCIFDKEVSTKFTDVLNSKERDLVLRCGSKAKIAKICLGNPENGGVPLACIHRPCDDVIMEVAANVDIAICVMMCIDLVAIKGR